MRKSKPVAFGRLNATERVAFVKKHHGLFQDVANTLAESNTPFHNSTISRTWYGHFRSPNGVVVKALECEYLRLLRKKPAKAAPAV